MIGVVIVSSLALLSGPGGSELYAPPPVRPFEPPSDFGRERAQGDADMGPFRRPLAAPVSVEAYRRSYEASQTDAEVAYEQGVAQREIDMDARMGPLDGAWRVLDAEGETVMALVLSDGGDYRAVEGAWRAPGHDRPSLVLGVERPAADAADIALAPESGLRLMRGQDGVWAGVMHTPQGERPVVLRR